MAEILPLFDDLEAHELPVVEPGSRRLVGMLNRRDLITALSVEVLQTRNLRAKFVEHQGAEHYVEIPPGHEIRRIAVPQDMVGRSLSDIDLRQQTGITVLTILQVRNGREMRTQPTPRSVSFVNRRADRLGAAAGIGQVDRQGRVTFPPGLRENARAMKNQRARRRRLRPDLALRLVRDGRFADVLAKRSKALWNEACGSFCVNVRGLEFINSTALGYFVAKGKELSEAGGALVFLGAVAVFSRRRFAHSNFITSSRFFPSDEKAEAHLQTGGA